MTTPTEPGSFSSMENMEHSELARPSTSSMPTSEPVDGPTGSTGQPGYLPGSFASMEQNEHLAKYSSPETISAMQQRGPAGPSKVNARMNDLTHEEDPYAHADDSVMERQHMGESGLHESGLAPQGMNGRPSNFATPMFNGQPQQQGGQPAQPRTVLPSHAEVDSNLRSSNNTTIGYGASSHPYEG